jgi:hypothetical protein
LIVRNLKDSSKKLIAISFVKIIFFGKESEDIFKFKFKLNKQIKKIFI